MTRSAIGIGVMAVAVVVMLSVGVAVAVMDDEDMHQDQAGYAGMMGAMGDMDSDAMLARMKEVLSDEDYQRMLGHTQAHRSGVEIDHAGIKQLMHRMMDGMMTGTSMDAAGTMGNR